MDNTLLHMYTPCGCGRSDLVLVSTTKNITEVPPGTRCIACRNCKTISKVEDWNKINDLDSNE